MGHALNAPALWKLTSARAWVATCQISEQSGHVNIEFRNVVEYSRDLLKGCPSLYITWSRQPQHFVTDTFHRDLDSIYYVGWSYFDSSDQVSVGVAAFCAPLSIVTICSISNIITWLFLLCFVSVRAINFLILVRFVSLATARLDYLSGKQTATLNNMGNIDQ